MKVLTVQFDVTNLSEAQISNLQLTLEVQGEDVTDEDGVEDPVDAPLLNSGVREINEEDYQDSH